MERWLAIIITIGLFVGIYRLFAGPREIKKSTQAEHGAASAFWIFAVAPPYVWWLLRYWGWLA